MQTVTDKNSFWQKKLEFFLLTCLLILNCGLPGLARTHRSASTQTQSKQSKKHHHKKLVHKKTAQEIAAAKEAVAREAEENRFNQSRNANLSRAYQLFDSGTGEALLGNYKYSVLQLKLANELILEHGEENSALGIAVLSALASSAKAAGDQQLARSTYEKLLLLNPQDTSTLLKLANLQAQVGDFHAARTSINKAINADPDNQEALLLSDLIERLK